MRWRVNFIRNVYDSDEFVMENDEDKLNLDEKGIK